MDRMMIGKICGACSVFSAGMLIGGTVTKRMQTKQKECCHRIQNSLMKIKNMAESEES